MKDKISVIIPVYKVEKYLKKCIESVINQTHKNLEIILVDDGSPDNCPKICDDYANIDKRIRVIHKINGGLSDARNYGLKYATGKWVSFVDSDDYLDLDYFEYLLKLTNENKSDISVILPQIFYEDKKIKKKNNIEKIITINNLDSIELMLYQKEFDNSAWGKLFKKELVENIEFPIGKLYEDISTTYKYILKSNSLTYSNQKKYYYLKRKGSIMGQSFNKRDMDYIYQAEDMYNDIKNINNNLEIAARCRMISANFSILKKIIFKKNTKTYKKIIRKNIKKYRKGLLFNNKVRTKVKITLCLSYLFC